MSIITENSFISHLFSQLSTVPFYSPSIVIWPSGLFLFFLLLLWFEQIQEIDSRQFNTWILRLLTLKNMYAPFSQEVYIVSGIWTLNKSKLPTYLMIFFFTFIFWMMSKEHRKIKATIYEHCVPTMHQALMYAVYNSYT